jgi:GT2 family glycosyltransferase
MSETLPLVTILIATKDRASDLRVTLREMRKQRYPLTELLVIDDGSKVPVEPLVREAWPGASVIRHEKSAGQCARRNEGFAHANGEYILQLDDDCSLTCPEDLAYAIDQMRRRPEAGAIACYIVNSAVLPANIETSNLQSGCVASFVGAAVLFRKSAVQQTEGYRAFFGNEWEEEELALQLLGRGWQIVFLPRIVAHHRLSLLNRNTARTWMRGLRNRLWAVIIHIPFWRLPFEIGWKMTVGAWDAVRLMRPGRFLRALLEASAGVPRAWSLRRPLSPKGLNRYDALRLRPFLTPAEFDLPPEVTFAAFSAFWRRWRNRARNRSLWEREPGDTGRSYTVAYAHEERFVNAPPTADGK